MCNRYINRLPFTHPQLGTWPATQTCALTGNQTSYLSGHRPALNSTGPHQPGQCLLKNLYFIDYAITVVLIFLPLCPSTQQPPLPQAIPTPVFMSMGHMYKFFGYSISYTVLHIPMANSVTTFLIPSPLHPFPHTLLPSGHHQNALSIHDSVSVLIC